MIKKRFTYLVPIKKSTVRELAKYAHGFGISMQEIVSWALEDYLKQLHFERTSLDMKEYDKLHDGYYKLGFFQTQLRPLLEQALSFVNREATNDN